MVTLRQFKSVSLAVLLLTLPIYFGVVEVGGHHPFGAAVCFTIFGWNLRYYFVTLHA
jgi:hypothetical protein